jgi:hypothetical protein
LKTATPNGKPRACRSNQSLEASRSQCSHGEKTHRADTLWPIIGGKDHTAVSVFRPEALLREARRQKQLPLVAVPEICVLDPDGDFVRHIRLSGSGRTHEGWRACSFILSGAPQR